MLYNKRFKSDSDAVRVVNFKPRLAAHMFKKVPIVLHEQTGKQRAVAPFAAFLCTF